jgi:hypothetical protein
LLISIEVFWCVGSAGSQMVVTVPTASRELANVLARSVMAMTDRDVAFGPMNEKSWVARVPLELTERMGVSQSTVLPNQKGRR